MSYSKAIALFKQCWIYYLTGVIIVLSIKYFYRHADCDDLNWILAPTSTWVQILSGISFENDLQLGYINHQYRFIIAPSCSGVQFMSITIATLIFSFVHRIRSVIGRFSWITFSVFCSFVYTIFINGFRIVLSIKLPIILNRTISANRWLSPDKLHSIIGIIIYFTSLCLIYHVAGSFFVRSFGMFNLVPGDTKRHKSNKPLSQIIGKWMRPLFWYYLIALGIPLLNHAYRNEGTIFIEYVLLITGVCTAIVFCLSLISIIRKDDHPD